ncbi:hypothetical protein [Streptomyces sp. NPDC057413]|uniref:hypothetical protein n=1 Tax=Streptomyces sp. NPDC057413 TaxID=3346124 RepID=UPI00367488A4
MNSEAEYRDLEFAYVTARLNVLYARVRAGEDSAVLRERIARLEALQQALCGFPEALAA